ncbi:MAG: ATP phosphoribosyltransferase regulatory subunit [Alphaproteobacteria bacterium]
MSDQSPSTLLPAGFQDVLPPIAAHEARTVASLLSVFESYGYERVRPPLVEFEESLLGGSGAAMASRTFRVMDPVSQHMMGVRADLTLQIARIAVTRLGTAPRPLRLSYAGDALRVRGTQLVPERELTQVGVEIIGTSAPAADAEVIVLAAEALGRIGVEGLSVDLNSPRLVEALMASLGIKGQTARALRAALDHKDAARVAAVAGSEARLFGTLLNAAGPAEAALEELGRLALPKAANAELQRVGEVVALVHAAAPGLELTLDPVENRGFEYHTGVGFSFFAAGARGELGRGGRYVAVAADRGSRPGEGEPSTGFTLAMETVMGILPEPKPGRRLYVPFGAAADVTRVHRAQGWAVLAGLEVVADPRAEARRLGCTHVVLDGAIVALGTEG